VADFSTRTWPGASADITTPAQLEAAVQTNSAVIFAAPLAASALNPPTSSASGQWSSTGHYIQTRPVGVAGAVILATLRNDSGLSRSTVVIGYDLTVVAPLIEEVPGHAVYYSLTGTPGAWNRIETLSNN